MNKKYGLRIDGDTIDFLSIDFDENTNSPINEEAERLYNIVSRSNNIINISSLNYIPENGSLWDGESFSNYQDLNISDSVSTSNELIESFSHQDFERFAFLENNVLLGTMYYNKNNSKSNMFIAALSSSPEIVELV